MEDPGHGRKGEGYLQREKKRKLEESKVVREQSSVAEYLVLETL